MNKYTYLLALVACMLTFSVSANSNSVLPGGVFRMPKGVTASDYTPQTIIIKIKPNLRNSCSISTIANSAFLASASKLGAVTIKKIFPNHEAPAQERNAHGQKLADLSLIYEIKYTSPVNIEKAINAILQSGTVVYAEPRYIYHLNYNPNDPSTGTQYFLTKIQAYTAWDISHGDTNVVVGIVDSGTDWDHPDLQSNIKLNYNDPINGIDDDGDGYTDNWRGWDMSENDNNPMIDNSDHGSHVSGCAAAVTDNGVGVASPGFNCRFLPVKCADAQSTTTIDHGYEGITYAADHGCSVINCSWGGPGGGQMGQDVITYAAINKGALVCASAGNSSADEANYPASYDYAFNVASTNSSDLKSSFSTYNYSVDVCAPGSNIFSTLYNNTYASMSGTSMASPICAGGAALVKSMNPTYTGLQVGEQLRMTADNIYTGGNLTYLNKLGTGRINLYRALTETPISVRYENIAITDGNDEAFVIGDTMSISGDVVNYLAPTTNLTAVLSTVSGGGFVTILSNTITPGAMATLASINNSANPFTVKINAGTPQNSVVGFKLTFTDGTYTSSQFFSITVNVDYINITINDVWTTVTSKGKLFYNSDQQAEGLGFTYLGNNLVYDGGLMIGRTAAVSDVIRDGGVWDQDFVSAQVVQKVIPSVKSEFDLYGKFNDNAAATQLKVLVTHQAYAWSTTGNRKYVIVEYSIKNTGTSSLNTIYAGIWADWDIMNFANNKADIDNGRKLGYCFSTDVGGLYAGVKVLTAAPHKIYSIDNLNGGSGGVDIVTDYTSAEKFTTLSTNRNTAGGAGTGNDVCQSVSTGPFTLAVNDSVVVAFAILAGDDLNDLQISADSAQIKYDGFTSLIKNPELAENILNLYPNPAKGNLLISYTANTHSGSIELINPLGQKVQTVDLQKQVSGLISIDVSHFEKGVYICRYTSNGVTVNKKVVIE